MRIEVDRLELGLLQALSDLGVADERSAEAFPCAPEDIAPYREKLRADENSRRPAALTKRWGQFTAVDGADDSWDDQPDGR